MHVCETALQLTNRHLWLGPVDQDWHRPLQVNLKPFWARNFQYRTQHSAVQSARRDKYWVDPRANRTVGWQSWRGEAHAEAQDKEHASWKKHNAFEHAEDTAGPWKGWSTQHEWQPPWKQMQPTEPEQYRQLNPRPTAASSSSSSGSWRPQLPRNSSTEGPWRQEEKEDEKASPPWSNRGWNSYT